MRFLDVNKLGHAIRNNYLKVWYFVDHGKVMESNKGDIYLHKIDLTIFTTNTNEFTENFVH